MAVLVLALLSWRYVLVPWTREPLRLGVVVSGSPTVERQFPALVDVTLLGLNTILSDAAAKRPRELRVIAVDRVLCRGVDCSAIPPRSASLRHLRVKLDLHRSGTVALSAEVIAPDRGVEFVKQRSAPAEKLITLQNALAIDVLRAYGITLRDDEIAAVLSTRGDDMLASYERLIDSLDGTLFARLDDSNLSPPFDAAAASSPPAPALERDIGALLEQYRLALRDRVAERVAGLQPRMTADQRRALARYLRTANGLEVGLSDVAITTLGEGRALVGFTREDAIRRAGRVMRLRLRILTEVARDDERWVFQSQPRRRLQAGSPGASGCTVTRAGSAPHA